MTSPSYRHRLLHDGRLLHDDALQMIFDTFGVPYERAFFYAPRPLIDRAPRE